MNTLIKFLLIINIITLNQNTAFAAAEAEESVVRRRPNPMMAGLGAALMAAREKRQQRAGAGSDKVCDGVGTGTAKTDDKPKKVKRVNPFLDALSGNTMFGAGREEEYVVEGVGCAVAKKEPVACASGHSYKGAADPKALVPTGLMAELFAKLASRSGADLDEGEPAVAAFATASPAPASATPEGKDLMVAEKEEVTPAAATAPAGWAEGWIPDLSGWSASMPTVRLPDLSSWLPSASVAKVEIPDFSNYLPSGKFVDLGKWADSLPDSVLDALLTRLGYDDEGYTTANE